LRLLLWDAVKSRGLTPVQAQILLYLRNHREHLCRVGQIAREFGLTTATVSDSVSALEAKGLLRREPWSGDARVATLALTDAGVAAAAELDGWATPLREAVAGLAPAQQEKALLFLIHLIERLQQRGVITVARMCTTCRFFRRNLRRPTHAPYYCALIDRPLAVADLRVDCPEHEPAIA
jgi:DNA-binding MarR family transcriptional regulator